MKTYENSREGNDCHIYEHWIWHPKLQVAVKLTQYSQEDEVKANVYRKVDELMPPPVLEWFRSDPRLCDLDDEDIRFDDDFDYDDLRH